MSGAMIDVRIEDKEIRETLNLLGRRARNLKPAFSLIGEIVRTSIVRNFEKSGRPREWKGHSETTEKRRGKGAKILQDQGAAGGLSGSIKWKASADKVKIGTNKVYGAVHQYGAKKGSFGIVAVNIQSHLRKAVSGKSYKVKAHTRKVSLPWGDIPARPFLMVQDEDWTEILAALNDYLMEGFPS
jgi:phage virion morphogenesis protein